ncbi:MAG TPA: molecular chaperone HtpG [Chitinophagaceae bacterium]|nr:molecular chaperone HtpG [Chitinophagaceae bacterium]
MEKGQIRVQTENIFPIIKKFLYSEHDIFLRELISNAVDASSKIKVLASSGEATGELGELRIDVLIDKEQGTLSIVDRGIGMTAEEVNKYINQVAFSSAEEFLQKYKGQDAANIIGHFGLGFYSAFMVSSRVELYTHSYREGSQAMRWTCDGSPEYSLEATDYPDRGTRVVLHLNEDSREFLEPERVEAVLRRFCRFLPIPIFFQDKQINQVRPAWTRKPADLTSQDYQDFYRELYPMAEPPLFWIHLNVDYPFNLTGILYFPRIRNSYEIQKDKIQLYSNQVFVTDEVKDIVPEFLMLLHGVIDSPDIPLNVSRSYLQGDPNVRKINSHITRKVADKLEEIFRTERKEFEEKWESIGLFVKYGMITDDKFREKAEQFLLFQDTSGTQYYTREEYREATEALQKNKEGKLVVLYTTNPVQQHSYIQAARDKGYRVIKLDTLVDAAFISNIEMKWEGFQFKRVDADIADNLIDPAETIESALTRDEEQRLRDLFSRQVAGITLQVEIKGLSPEAAPVTATRSEFMRRMKDMAALNGGMQWYGEMPDEVTLTVNGNHPLYRSILAEKPEQQERLVHNLADLALLSQGLLKGSDLTAFISRSISIMEGEKKSPLIL